MVLKANLHYFVGESEHNSMLGPHPFLDVDYRLRLPRIIIRAWCVIFHFNVALYVSRFSTCRAVCPVCGVLWTIF